MSQNGDYQYPIEEYDEYAYVTNEDYCSMQPQYQDKQDQNIDLSTTYICDEAGQLAKKISQIINYLLVITSMPRYCLIELWEKCNFNQYQVLQLMDNKNSHWAQINYHPEKNIERIVGDCSICSQRKQLLKMESNYAFCLVCLQQYLKHYYKNFNQSQLFPNCWFQGNKEKMNGLILEIVCQDSLVRQVFDKLLCVKYSHSKNITLCSRTSCQSYITNTLSSPVVTCKCGNRMCVKCKKEDHFPLLCSQYSSQNNIFYSKNKVNQYQKEQIKNIVYFPHCPKCKVFISKDGGCPHMKCLCGFDFCWNCLSQWEINSPHLCEFRQKVYNQHFQVKEKVSDDDQFAKTLKKVQLIGSRLYHLQSDNIERMVEQLIKQKVLTIHAQKLLYARNKVINFYRLYNNLQAYCFYHKALTNIRKQVQQIKSYVDTLYTEILNPSSYLEKCKSYLSNLDDTRYINYLIVKTGNSEEQIRKKLQQMEL